MTFEIVLKFIKSFWRELIIAGLVATVLFMNIQQGILESELALCNQEKLNIEERLKVSNSSITALEQAISHQNEELTKISTQGQEKIKGAQKALQEAKNNNLQLQEKIDNLQKDSYDSSVDEYTNIKNLLKNVGE
jgi:predicted  nucleic acid-binding Zn-ribbon protein